MILARASGVSLRTPGARDPLDGAAAPPRPAEPLSPSTMLIAFADRSAHQMVNRARRGFTMVELMVVIAIIGVMSGVVTLSWRAILPRESLNAEVRRLSDVIQTARSEAISRSAEYRVVYNLETNTYWLLTPFGEKGEYEPEPEKRRPLLRHTLSPEISFDSITIDGESFGDNEEVFVRFDAVGSSNAHTIVLAQEGKNTLHRTIEVLPLTGLIRFHEGIYERDPASDSDFDE